jgi:hypothetical protein
MVVERQIAVEELALEELALEESALVVGRSRLLKDGECCVLRLRR